MRSQLRSNHGFTLIELMIAVMIVANLAVIALPALNEQRSRAKDSAAQQSLEAGLRSAKAIYTEGESYPASGLETLMGRAERSQSFANGSAFVQGQVSVERVNSGRVTLRTLSRSGREFMLTSDEPTAMVRRYSPPAASTVSTLPTFTNLVANPSFEANTTGWVNTGPAGWLGAGAGAVGRTFANGAPSGQFWGYVGVTASGQGFAFQLPALQAGRHYRVSTSASLAGGSRAVQFFVGRADGSQSATWNGTLPGNAWTRASVSLTPTSNASDFWVGIRSTATYSDSLYMDAVLVTEVSDPGVETTYFDGASLNNSWTGAAHASTSTGPGLGRSDWTR